MSQLFLMIVTSIFSIGSNGVISFSQFTASPAKVMNDEPRPIRGTVRNQSMNPVSGASVYLYNSTATTLIATTSTDSEGAYSFNPVQPGTYYMVAFQNPTGADSHTVVVSTFDVTQDFVLH